MVLLQIRNLNVYYNTLIGKVKILNDLNLDVDYGDIVGVVGESGSGKSTLGYAIAKILPPNASMTGEILFEGVNLLNLDEKEMQKYRGTQIFMVFQNALNSLNPVKKVGFQLGEALKIKYQKMGKKVSEDEIYKEVIDVLKDLRLPDPEVIYERYPHQLSGGQIQRVIIAMALLLRPKLLIADEPTSAIDVTLQAQVVNLFKQINQEAKISIIFITHDISLAYAMSNRILVLYAGRIMEEGNTEEIIKDPMHPYTQGLIASIPKVSKSSGKLYSIPGLPPSFYTLPAGCKFHPRCPKVMPICKEKEPQEVHVNNRRVRCWLYE